MTVFIALIAIVFACFGAAFITGLHEQRREEQVQRRLHQESEQWLKEHGEGF